ncbi:hypothetical protein [uncultured Sphingobacterium sp.]|jgi:hypothetical protein|uniref:hypothetical protein n=1 Tax=uncultured Sphingobacterium sp. TaxID=182688 RepID=UPI003747DF55
MMTSWNETRQIEAYIFGIAEPEDALLFEAKLVLDEELAQKIIAQQKAYAAIRQFGRKQVKMEIEAITQALFTHPEHVSFRKKIIKLFSKS